MKRNDRRSETLKNKIIVILALGLGFAFTARAQVPGIINYQGRVSVNGTNFTGTGQFSFALVDGGQNVNQQARAGVAFYDGNSGVAQINLPDNGSGYTSTPTVVITDPLGPGTGAVAVADLDLTDGGIITNVEVLANGADYNNAVITIAPPPVSIGFTTFWSNDGSSVAGSQTVAAVSLPVTKGLYSVLLGDTTLSNMTAAVSAAVFSNSDVNLRVWFNDGVHGVQQLAPDQRIAAAGYALNAANVADGSITSVKIANNAVTSSQIAGGAVGAFQIAAGAVDAFQIGNAQVVKSLNGKTDAVTLAAGANVTIGINGQTLTIAATGGGGGGSNGWSLAGNAGTNPTNGNFLGTTDLNPLELRADGMRVLRLEPDPGGGSSDMFGSDVYPPGSPNVISGSSANSASPTQYSGGRLYNQTYLVIGATIAGGGDTVGSPNVVEDAFATIGGGQGNSILANSTYDNGSTIAGGDGNVIDSSYESTIAGGSGNGIAANAYQSIIGGGSGNAIQSGASQSTIGGGANNQVQANTQYGFVGGGQGNHVLGSGAAIGGGIANYATANFATVGGGGNNVAGQFSATVAGGNANHATGAGAFIGGGGYDGTSSAGNTATAGASVVGGGLQNSANISYATVAGGRNNTAGNSGSGLAATIGGGSSNTANSAYSTVGGGQNNTAGTGLGGTDATVAGGYGNTASGVGAFVGGGGYDGVDAPEGNTASGADATVGGGLGNKASNTFATVPGGLTNTASGFASFAAGDNAKATDNNSFVWGDGSAQAISQGANSFTALATGGVWFYTSDIGAGLHLGPGGSSWGSPSNRNVKKNFQAVDTVAVLEMLAAIPVQRWNYNWEKDEDVPNIGPMAQDFKAAFYPGRDDKTITTMEFDGVELAAIQGLNQKLEQRLKEKDTRIAALEKRLADLEQLVKQGGNGQ